MTRIIAISLLIILIIASLACWWWVKIGAVNQDQGMSPKYHYLVVSVDAPPEWGKQHIFSFEWEGKSVQIPIVFRMPVSKDSDQTMGAGPEALRYLEIRKKKIPVTVNPDTEYQVRNTGAFAFLPEKSDHYNAFIYSYVNWVTVSPPNQPGIVGPNGPFESNNARLEKLLQELLIAGKVIDIAKH